MITPRLPAIPTELYEFYPAMSAGSHAALVKEYALSAIAKTIQAAKLEAYQEAAKVADEYADAWNLADPDLEAEIRETVSEVIRSLGNAG